ncbi:MAG: DNA-protecting protein DprA, partial [Candidatus Omnitrophica bacterium]|nr:DNA-protecting protein DprA [Candidatus Omnitrophota bacterium]
SAGFTITSGLAVGIDTAAHRGALKGKGRTIAVLGGGVDCIYPAENEKLAEEIAQHGAVVSEYCLGRQPDKTTFPVRNRIISGLSMGVVVIEATKQSGAMITVNQALSQGRQVFAVPGRIDSAQSSGCNELIKNGAILTSSIEDILGAFEFIFPQIAKDTQSVLLSDKDKIILDILSDGESDVDQIIQKSGITPSEVNVALLSLEMRHLVRVLPGRRVSKV